MNHYPPGNRHIRSQRTFESMIFRTSLSVGYGFVPWRVQGSLLNNQDFMDFVSDRFLREMPFNFGDELPSWEKGIFLNTTLVGEPIEIMRFSCPK